MRRIPALSTLTVLALAAAVFGAGTAASAQDQDLAQVRLMHASADSPAIKIQVDGLVAASGLTFGQATDYFILPAGEHTVTISPGGPEATGTPSFQQTLILEPETSITALLIGSSAAPDFQIFQDDRAPLALGTGRLTVIHAAETLEAVDLQTADGATLVGGVGPGKASPPVELPAGIYNLTLTATDGDGTALPGSSALEINTGTLYTIVMLDGGSLTLTVPTKVAETEAAPAHLRLAHASANAPKVDLYLNDVKAVAGLSFGNASEPIALLPGDYAVALYPTDADTASTSPLGGALTLAAGESRVLVVMGNLEALQLIAFGEDFTPPSPGATRLNFIHAVPGAPAVNLVLADDTVLVENLPFGGQSSGRELSPSIYEVSAVNPANNEALLQLSRAELTAGRAYTTIIVPPSQGTQIVIPLTFSVPLAPAAPAVAQPAETAEPDQEAAEAPTPEVAADTAEAAEPTEPAAAQAIGEAIGRVITDPGYFLNVRNEPGLNRPPQPIPGLPSGAEVFVQGRDVTSQWLYINWNPPDALPVQGWVSALYVEVTIDGKPVLYVEELPLAFGDETPVATTATTTITTEIDTGETEIIETDAGEEAAPAIGPGAATFTITDFNYTDEGRMARMWVNVTNHSMTPALASGNWYPTPNPDGGRQWVTLLKSGFLEGSNVPYPYAGDAPLWEFTVITDDGLVFPAYAGCEYYNEIVGEGFEPTAEGGFTWSQVLEGGWWSCGGDWGAGNIKPDHDLLPGETASVSLNIWLVNPHMLPDDPALTRRRIVRLDFIPKLPDGTSFGAVDSQVPPQ